MENNKPANNEIQIELSERWHKELTPIWLLYLIQALIYLGFHPGWFRKILRHK